MLEQLLKMLNVTLSFNKGKIWIERHYDQQTGEPKFYLYELMKGGKQERFSSVQIEDACKAFINLVSTGDVTGKAPEPVKAEPKAPAKK